MENIVNEDKEKKELEATPDGSAVDDDINCDRISRKDSEFDAFNEQVDCEKKKTLNNATNSDDIRNPDDEIYFDDAANLEDIPNLDEMTSPDGKKAPSEPAMLENETGCDGLTSFDEITEDTRTPELVITFDNGKKSDDVTKSNDETVSCGVSNSHDVVTFNDLLKSDDEISPEIKSAATRKYTWNLLKDINVAFDRKNKLENSSSTPVKRGNVASIVRNYEERIEKIYENFNTKINSNYAEAHREWTHIALDTTAKPQMSRNKFKGRRWIDPVSSVKKNDEEEKEVETLDPSTKEELHKIARELLVSEKTYVEILRVLDQVFYKRLLEAAERNIVPGNVPDQIFRHLSSIFYFHSKYLYPQLADRLSNWDSTPRIGDIMMQAGPFLKMYALYINNNNEAQETLQNWRKKSKDFNNFIQAIEHGVENELFNMGIKVEKALESHLLTPVQRTPRYQMLLDRFLRKLPQHAEQRKEVETALDLVSVAASHSNKFIEQKEKKLQLMKIYDKLALINFDTEDISRELLKEGKVAKLAARSGKENERYLYLFNDLLLCCKECSSVHKIQGKTHKVSATLSLMDLFASADSSSRLVFFVDSVQKQLEFRCGSEKDRNSWIDSINEAVSERTEKENSLQRGRSNSCGSIASAPRFEHSESPAIARNRKYVATPMLRTKRSVKDEDLGMRAPQWIRDQDVTMCMRCSEPFHSIFRRRHHCRACGQVVCSTCSNKSLLLAYNPKNPQRVCKSCFENLNKVDIYESASDKRKASNDGDDQDLLLFSAFLQVEHKQKWNKLWCIVPQSSPQTCICYKAKMDMKPFLLLSFRGSQIGSTIVENYSHSFVLADILGNRYVFASNERRHITELKDIINNTRIDLREEKPKLVKKKITYHK